MSPVEPGSRPCIRYFAGVYQIGEVYARSCVIIGIFAGIFTP